MHICTHTTGNTLLYVLGFSDCCFRQRWQMLAVYRQYGDWIQTVRYQQKSVHVLYAKARHKGSNCCQENRRGHALVWNVTRVGRATDNLVIPCVMIIESTCALRKKNRVCEKESPIKVDQRSPLGPRASQLAHSGNGPGNGSVLVSFC